MSKTKTPEFERQARHKERGLWNFLTWSFFLSQVLADGEYARAAVASPANAEELSEHGGPATQASARLPMDPALGSNVTDETGHAGAQPHSAAAAAQGALADVNAHAVSDFAAAKIAGHSDARHSAHVGTSAGGHVGLDAGGDVAPPGANDPNDPSTGGGSGVDLPDILSPIGSGVVDLIDDLLDPPLSAVGDTVGDLTDCLAETIDDVMASLDAATSLVGQVTSTLTPVLGNTLTGVTASASQVLKDVTAPLTATVATVTDGLSDLIGSDNVADGGLVGGVVSSAGQIVFKPLSIGGDLPLDLFSGGKYTDYNLTLRAEHGPDTQGNASAATSSSSTLLDKLLAPDAADASHAQRDNPAAPALAHVLDDIWP